MFDRAQAIHDAFLKRVAEGRLPEPRSNLTPGAAGLSPQDLVDLFESQVMSRHVDLVSRRMKGRSYYSIGSSGHEGNAAVGKAFRHTDMAFLHYRSGALFIQRTKHVPGSTPLSDLALSIVASADDPVSGGRHKVFGGKAIFTPPQTSTIASHLPKAVGAAYSIGLARHLTKTDTVMPRDAVVLVSFGDASTNHSTAQGAFNTAAWASYSRAAMPIVFLCEDNGIGISVPTPRDWIRASFEHRTGLHYMACDGLDLLDAWRGASAAAAYARRHQKPVFLHMRTVRLMGHAGADIEAGYTPVPEIERVEADDPLLHTAGLLIRQGILSPQEVLGLYRTMEARVARVAEEAAGRPRLTDARAVMASLHAPKREGEPASPVKAPPVRDRRLLEQPQPMARLINLTLAEIMVNDPDTVVFGQDVGRKGGVYSVTSGLQDQFGPSRVLDTLLDEQAILGLAIGLSQNGFLPIPEIQFLAYVHNAEDQIRGEAATLPFFSDGQFDNPMVIRIAGLAYQKGFGGHFHNDNSIAIFRDIPGIILACPSNGADACAMLRTCVDLARRERRVVVFLEPIALYMAADLHESKDKLWLSQYQPPDKSKAIPFGEIGQHGDGQDLAIVTYGNGYYLSRQAAKRLEDESGLRIRVIDLRWLAPLNEEAILEAVRPCKAILMVEECRRTGSLSEQLYQIFTDHDVRVPIKRVAAEDSFIPLGPAANHVLPSVESIMEAARGVTDQRGGKPSRGKQGQRAAG